MKPISLDYFSRGGFPSLEIGECYYSILYVVYEIRYAWYGYLSDRYYCDVFFNDYESARLFCKRERKRGSIFRIVLIPCVVSKIYNKSNRCVVIADVSWSSPFSWVSIEKTKKIFEKARSVAGIFNLGHLSYILEGKSRSCFVFYEECSALERRDTCPSRRIWESDFHGIWANFREVDDTEEYDTQHIRQFVNVLNGEM